MQTKSTIDGVMKSPENEIEEIQVTLEAARNTVALRDDLLKLSQNKQFKKVILEAYLKDEAVRLVEISGQPFHKENREEIMDAIKGISHFRQWMELILMRGDNAEVAIREHELSLQDLLESEGIEQ